MYLLMNTFTAGRTKVSTSFADECHDIQSRILGLCIPVEEVCFELYFGDIPNVDAILLPAGLFLVWQKSGST